MACSQWVGPRRPSSTSLKVVRAIIPRCANSHCGGPTPSLTDMASESKSQLEALSQEELIVRTL